MRLQEKGRLVTWSDKDLLIGANRKLRSETSPCVRGGRGKVLKDGCSRKVLYQPAPGSQVARAGGTESACWKGSQTTDPPSSPDR